MWGRKAYDSGAALVDIEQLLADVRLRWDRAGIPSPVPASPSEIDRFELKVGRRLPDDLRTYFLTLNGMPEDHGDRALFRFIPLAQVQDVIQLGWASEPQNTKSLYMLVDLAIGAACYAVRLSAPGSGSVFSIRTDEPVMVSESWSQFLALYLDDSPLLYQDYPPGR